MYSVYENKRQAAFESSSVQVARKSSGLVLQNNRPNHIIQKKQAALIEHKVEQMRSSPAPVQFAGWGKWGLGVLGAAGGIIGGYGGSVLAGTAGMTAAATGAVVAGGVLAGGAALAGLGYLGYRALGGGNEPPPGRAEMQGRFQQLSGNERWREHVDLRHQGHGPDVYETGAHRPGEAGSREPGYTADINSARARVHDNLGSPLSVEEYERIHSLAVASRPGAIAGGGWRKENEMLSTGVRVNSQVQGRNRDLTLGLTAPTVEIDSNTREGRPEVSVSQFGDEQSRIEFLPRTAREVKGIIAGILQRYNGQIAQANTHAAKLTLIAQTHQLLERVHAFRDGNTRTNLLVLNKMLTEQGYHPVILDDPNTSYLLSTDEWVQQLDRGLRRWQSVREGNGTILPEDLAPAPAAGIAAALPGGAAAGGGLHDATDQKGDNVI